MNYQKLLSRFYPASDSNPADLPKCNDFTKISPEETTSNIPNENTNFEFPNQDDDSLLFSNDIELNGSAWEPSVNEQLSSSTEPINADQVRWFYKTAEDKIWCEFSGYDSLLIENKYREFKLLEKTEKSTTDNEPSSEIQDIIKEINAVPLKSNKHDDEKLSNVNGPKSNINSVNDNNGDVKNHENTITVRGGMYEIDLETMMCESIYWPGEQCIITRGLYFYDGSWQPLEGCYGEILEEEHLRLFGKDSGNVLELVPAQPGIAVHSHHFTDFHVEWLSSSDIYLYWGGAPRQLVRSVTQKLGFYQSTGYKLKRGFKKKASNLERPPDISHVVFVIHGIGQKMDSGRIIRNTNALRTNCDWLRTQYPKCGGGENNGRAELFPAKWRAGERGDASDLLAAAAPLGAPALRRAINDAAMDVMYYTSPVYGKQVQDDLTHELNRLYLEFMARNPNYKGQFSAVAHSLGCVILYDIITGFQIGCERCAKIDGESKPSGSGRLLFQLQQLFCLGSPLGVFLALRQSTSDSQRILPAGFNTRLYNIFHLSDPVAYRLEPLVARWMAEHPPLVIPPHYTIPPTSPSSQASPAKGPWRIWSYVKHPWQRSETGSPIPIANMNAENASDMNDMQCSKSKNHENSPKKSISSNIDNIEYDNDDIHFNMNNQDMGDNNDCDENLIFDDNTGTSLETSRNPEEVLPYRIDYTLKDSFITNNYIWAITSHTSYWTNYDVAYFILTHLIPELGQEQEQERISF